MATFSEIARRVYHELVRRRSHVRIVTSSEQENTEKPIFLIGLYRSGTTLMRYVIDSHSRIACPPESDFIGFLEPVLTNKRSKAGLANMGFDDDHVTQRLRVFAAYFFNNYAKSVNKPRWADKSPAYVDHLDFLATLFPGAQFIIIYRHPLNQAHSHSRMSGDNTEFTLTPYIQPGEDARLGAVRYWREKTELMRAFAEKHPDRCHAVRYEDVCATPEPVLKAVFSFIGEAWEPAVMHFSDFSHDRGSEDGRTGATRGFEPPKDHYLEWQPALMQQCVEIASPLMEQLGYTVELQRA